MKNSHIFDILIAFALANLVLAGSAKDMQYDDENLEFDSAMFHMIYDLAMKPKPEKFEFVHPYTASDFEKLISKPIPNRYKQWLIDNYYRFKDDIEMTPQEAAFESLRYTCEDMLDIYQGRLNSVYEMAKFRKIRQTDPVSLMVAAAEHDKKWHKANAQKLFGAQKNPTFWDFRIFVKEYTKKVEPGLKAA